MQKTYYFCQLSLCKSVFFITQFSGCLCTICRKLGIFVYCRCVNMFCLSHNFQVSYVLRFPAEIIHLLQSLRFVMIINRVFHYAVYGALLQVFQNQMVTIMQARLLLCHCIFSVLSKTSKYTTDLERVSNSESVGIDKNSQSCTLFFMAIQAFAWSSA